MSYVCMRFLEGKCLCYIAAMKVLEKAINH
jgi:hypothetical protein